MTSEAHILFDRLLPESLEALLQRVLGISVPRLGEDGRFRISSCGRFTNHMAADLLAFARNQKIDGAFLVLQDDVARVLYLGHGVVVGADSNVLFERLGRVLQRGSVLTREDARRVVACEEQRGLAAAMALLPPEAAYWGIDKRTWEIGCALYFMSTAHFVFVDGSPDLGTLPRLAIPPMELAMEGLRRYDEWRHKSTPRAAPTEADAAAYAAAAAARAPGPGGAVQDVDEIMRMLDE